MCGLLASSGKANPRILIALGCLNSERGEDSAGIGWMEGEKLFIDKIAQNPQVAFPVSLYRSIMRATFNGGPVIGHTRQATHGAVTSKNAHPFLSEGIAFAHNGIILNHKDFGTFDVDSQSLIRGILQRDFSKYEGPIALVWIQEGQLHAYRKGNPLFRGVLNGAMYLASERGFLEVTGCKKVKELGEGRIYVFKGPDVLEAKTVPTNKTWGGYTAKPYHVSDYPKSWDYKGYKHPLEKEGYHQNECGVWVREGVLDLPKEKELTVIHSANGTIGDRRESRKNRLLLKGTPAPVEPDSLAELDEEAEAVKYERQCNVCHAEPSLPSQGYGALCAESWGMMGL